jgi:hypothetical protein
MRRRITEIEQHRDALSLRGLERRYGFRREFLGELVRDGKLPFRTRGRSKLVLRADFERWFRAEAERTRTHAEAVVDRVLDRERKPSAA